LSYALESKDETERLEKQSEAESYDFKEELSEVGNLEGKIICDAGSGSGIVSRYLAGKFPTSKIYACDASDIRIHQSKTKSSQFKNISFEVQNITQLSFENSMIDFLFSRFVLEHMNEKTQAKAVAEFHRCLKPGGKICLIDVDGAYYNIFPETKILRSGLQKFRKEKNADLLVGRKMPNLLVQAGFQDVHWRVQTLSFAGESLAKERELIKERFDTGAHYFSKILGSPKSFDTFKKEYLDVLTRPGATLFYTKWIASATKHK